MPTALFFKYNTQLGPPYQVLVDTNFINFSIKNKVRPGAPWLRWPKAHRGTATAPERGLVLGWLSVL